MNDDSMNFGTSSRNVDMLTIDREDLFAILLIRFGTIPDHIAERILSPQMDGTIERLILVAANVPALADFIEELTSEPTAFKLVGEKYHPLAKSDQQARAIQPLPQPASIPLQYTRKDQ